MQIGRIGVIYSIDTEYLSGVKQANFTSGNITLSQLVEGSSPPGITIGTRSTSGFFVAQLTSILTS